MTSRHSSKSSISTSQDSSAVLKRQLKKLSSAITYRPPFCQGTTPLPRDDFTIFYGKDTNARRLNLADASPEELQHLADTCDPATFGVNQTDVHDEAYRKAGQLDSRDFALKFAPVPANLLEIIRTDLLYEARLTKDNVRAELYKLNVYGPESFFKPHVDTPRSELMFGSLVVVFPTPHEGGTLMIRKHSGDNTREWAFESSALLAQVSEPSIAYVAFYSDVEHEVLPVQSGFRVTVTYNLYYVKENADSAPTPVTQSISTFEKTFKSTLQALLDDPTFLPEGANLVFCLHHQYPLSSHRQQNESRQALADLATRLKAGDAVILRVLRELSLDTAIRVIYRNRPRFSAMQYVMVDHLASLGGEVEEKLSDHLVRHAGGILLETDSHPQRYSVYDMQRPVRAHFITPVPWMLNATETSFMVYGNQAELDHAYWNICLYVRVGAACSRDVPVA